MSGTAMAGIDKTLSIMPFFNITNRELFQDVLFELESVKENICENTVFYNNLISTSNNDLLKQLQFAYCTDTEFNNLLCSKDVRNIELSIFHLNIRSLNRNHRGLIHLLQLIDHNFDVIVLSEIWKYNLEFYRSILKSYIFYYVEPQNSNVGGVGMFIKNKFNCVELNNFNLPSTSTAMVESLWLELTCDSKKYIVGAIYRHPNKNIRDFYTHTLNVFWSMYLFQIFLVLLLEISTLILSSIVYIWRLLIMLIAFCLITFYLSFICQLE